MDAPTITTMYCKSCGAQTDAKCACDVGYEPLAQRMERRRDMASELYKSGLTIQQIANKLDVGSETVRRDLSDLPNVGELKRPRTATNPKGAGRPKGSKTKKPKVKRAKPPGVKQAQRSIDLLPEVWEQVKTQAAAVGIPASAFIGTLITATIDPAIDLKALSKTAQDKVATAIRQHQKRLDREFESRVQAATKQRTDKVFPLLEKMEQEARDAERNYRGLTKAVKTPMTVAEYTMVCSLLHPDSRISASEERLRRAFQMFEPKKFALTGEK